MTAYASSSSRYQATLNTAMRVNWHIDDLIGSDLHLDFTKSFLPESLAGVKRISCLNEQEQRTLNQIRGNSYLHLFGLVEEFIVPAILDHVKSIGLKAPDATQAFLHFAEEESKHIQLFRQFAEAFEVGFGSWCDCIGPVQDIVDAVLAHSHLGVGLMILHIEWMTQRHYLESVSGNQEDLDPLFCQMLKSHWLEEAQHTKLDTCMLEEMIQKLSAAEVQQGIDDYFDIVAFLHEGLKMQIQLDIASLSRVIGHPLSEATQEEIRVAQERAYNWTFLGSGMMHPQVQQFMGELSLAAQLRLAEVAQAYS